MLLSFYPLVILSGWWSVCVRNNMLAMMKVNDDGEDGDDDMYMQAGWRWKVRMSKAPAMWPPVPPLTPVEMRMGGSPSSGMRLTELPTGAPGARAAYRVWEGKKWPTLHHMDLHYSPVRRKLLLTSWVLVLDLFEIWDTAGGWTGFEFWFGAVPLEESVVSPFGKIPSENQTLLCSRDRGPAEIHKGYVLVCGLQLGVCVVVHHYVLRGSLYEVIQSTLSFINMVRWP